MTEHHDLDGFREEMSKFRAELSSLNLGEHYQRGYDEYDADPAHTQYPTKHFQRMAYVSGQHYRKELREFYFEPASTREPFLVESEPCKRGWTRGIIYWVDSDPMWEAPNARGGWRCVYLGDLPGGEIIQHVNDVYYWNDDEASTDNVNAFVVDELIVCNHLDTDGNIIRELSRDTLHHQDGVHHREAVDAVSACLRLVFDDYRECFTETPEQRLARPDN